MDSLLAVTASSWPLGDAAPGVVRLVEPDTGREVARLIGPEPTRLHPLCFSPDGAQLITFGSESLEVHLFDLHFPSASS